MNGFTWALASARSHGVMVSTLDFESSDPSSSLGGTSFLFSLSQLFSQLLPSHTQYSLLFLIKICFYILQLPVLGFRVNQLPMGETVMGVWTSLVRLSGTGGRGAAVMSPLPAQPAAAASNVQSLMPTKPIPKKLTSSDGQR